MDWIPVIAMGLIVLVLVVVAFMSRPPRPGAPPAEWVQSRRHWAGAADKREGRE